MEHVKWRYIISQRKFQVKKKTYTKRNNAEDEKNEWNGINHGLDTAEEKTAM